MKYILNPFLALVMFSCYTANAQKDTTVFYLDSALAVTPRSAATCVEKIVYKDGLWYVSVFKIAGNSKIMTGSYKDRTLATAEGLFEYFNKGFVIMQGYYHDGEQSGIWEKWGNDSLLSDSVYFDAGNVVSQAKFKYHANKHLWRYSLETNTHEKIAREYDTLDVLVSEGRFKDEDGDTFIYYPDGKVKTHSVYRSNNLFKVDFFDEEGHKYTQKEYLEMMKEKQPG